ncbi:hypothetical protein TCAL_08458 [Tigriopus californicus]|uniref:Uncharacterized protein n=1 Tax=Tigriopus californicus TaxID=6832 RepID=A0A553N8B6_TIGCA|nr:hypothetical protein TCAL_08458 [Tigriopus californicus]
MNEMPSRRRPSQSGSISILRRLEEMSEICLRTSEMVTTCYPFLRCFQGRFCLENEAECVSMPFKMWKLHFGSSDIKKSNWSTSEAKIS